MLAHQSATEVPPYLHPGVARIILARSRSRQGTRLTFAVLLLSADANGIVTGYMSELAKVSGCEHATMRKHIMTLRRLGELDTLKSPQRRRPGMWRINALA